MKIYKIRCTLPEVEKIYIGQTTGELATRFKNHCHKGEMGFRYAITQALKKYGKENFIIEQIDSAETIEELNAKEIYWIAYFDTISPNGWNLTEGGKNGRMSEESKRKMSEAGKGKIPWNVGSEHSEETKRKIGEKALGHTRWLGKTHTEEAVQKMSDSNIGIPKPANRKPRKDMQKAILCTTNGIEYESVQHAATALGLTATHISGVAKGKRSHTGGFSFKYVDGTSGEFVPKGLKGETHFNYGRKFTDEHRDNLSKAKQGLPLNNKIIERNKKIQKPVTCITNGKTYESINAAAKDLGISDTQISNAAKNPKRSAHGYHFKYVEDINDNTRGNS